MNKLNHPDPSVRQQALADAMADAKPEDFIKCDPAWENAVIRPAMAALAELTSLCRNGYEVEAIAISKRIKQEFVMLTKLSEVARHRQEAFVFRLESERLQADLDHYRDECDRLRNEVEDLHRVNQQYAADDGEYLARERRTAKHIEDLKVALWIYAGSDECDYCDLDADQECGTPGCRRCEAIRAIGDRYMTVVPLGDLK